VIVYEADGLVISAFTTQEDAFAGRVGYRFDYRGRSIVVGADGATADSPAANNANVVLQSDGENPAQAAAEGHAANAGLVVLTGASNQMAAQVQVAEARAAGYNDVISARVGMVLELPLANNEVNVRAL
jgi:ribonuclease Z